jgi:arylformamidase
MKRIVDLSLSLQPGMRGVEFETRHTLAKDGWNARTLHLYSHCGTHLDAPIHVEATERTIDQISLQQCVGPAWVARIPSVRPKQLLEVADLGLLAAKVEPGDGLLLATGWSRFVLEPRYRDELPRISAGLARWCVDRRVRVLGVEPPSVADIHNLAEVREIHTILLGGGVLIVEGLTHFEALNSEKVTFVAAPLKLQGGDGSPVRAFAIEDGGAGFA